jgi:hypothetical protein
MHTEVLSYEADGVLMQSHLYFEGEHLMADEPDLERKEQGRVYFGIWRI